MTDISFQHMRIEQVIEQRASDRDRMTAVSTSDLTCVYRQLCVRARAVAEQIGTAVPNGGQPIGLLLPNSVSFVEAVLGVWFSGNVVVPISLNLSRESIERIVVALGINLVLMESTGRERFSGLSRTAVLHDDQSWSSPVELGGKDRVPVPMTAGHAVVFLTSGTTGHPKIVALTHRNILANLASLKKAVPLSKEDKSFVCVALCHSYGFTLQMLGTLCVGGELYIGGGHRISSDLVKEIQASRCTSFFGVPTAYRMLLDGIRRCGLEGQMDPLRVMVNGASSMTPEVLSGLRRCVPKTDIYLTYGLSEASPLVTVLPHEWVDEKPCSIGKAIDGVDLVLLCDNGQITTEAGGVGEILIKGGSVIEGYLGNAEANAASFCGKYLKTGDVAMIDADGCLFFKGRRKDLINRGGEKIYPEDVESVLQQHEAVMHSAVVPCPHESLGEVPFAFVVLREGGLCDSGELRRWCAGRLAPQQVPVGVRIVENLPRTVTGKVRKNELTLDLAGEQVQAQRENQQG